MSYVNRPSRARQLALGGVAAVALAGGSIIAVNSASAAPAAGSALPAVVAVTTPSGSTAAGATTGTGTAAPAPTPKVHTPHLAGTVTSVSGSTILIKDRDGFTRTIKVSASTKYADGLTAAVPVGTVIHASGTVDANGTTLDATEVGKAPVPRPGDRGPGGGPGGFGGPGPGGPGRGGHGPGGHGPGDGRWPGGTAGSGSSSPSSSAPTSAPTSTSAPTTS